MEKYNVVLTKKQLQYISKAVEMYARMQSGQIHSLSYIPALEEVLYGKGHDKFIQKREYIEAMLTGIKGLIWDDLTIHMSSGIGDGIGYDIYKVINYHIKKEWDAERFSNGEDIWWNVDSDPPYKHSEEPLPEITKIHNDGASEGAIDGASDAVK